MERLVIASRRALGWASRTDQLHPLSIRVTARSARSRALVETVRTNVTIDWTIRENMPAQLRVLVKRILRKHGYPPDKRDEAMQTVLEQAEVLSKIRAVA